MAATIDSSTCHERLENDNNKQQQQQQQHKQQHKQQQRYMCLQCYQSCDNWDLLAGDHVGHRAMPLAEALVWLPSAMARDADDALRHWGEAFVKPVRAQQLHLEGTLSYLLDAREKKLAAVEALLADLGHLHDQIAAAAQAKAIACCNWRYQRGEMNRRVQQWVKGCEHLAQCLSDCSSANNNNNNSDVSTSPVLTESAKHQAATALDELHKLHHRLRAQLKKWAVEQKEREEVVSTTAAADATSSLASASPPSPRTETIRIIESLAQQQKQQQYQEGIRDAHLHDEHHATAAATAVPLIIEKCGKGSPRPRRHFSSQSEGVALRQAMDKALQYRILNSTAAMAAAPTTTRHASAVEGGAGLCFCSESDLHDDVGTDKQHIEEEENEGNATGRNIPLADSEQSPATGRWSSILARERELQQSLDALVMASDAATRVASADSSGSSSSSGEGGLLSAEHKYHHK